ncbi:DUF3224 domain-containing protein [Nocardioides anomalus]|uniref:DUF3224 domain-containing protein n=1 Tax=Nocardioides anomalus TaxID=2712223 RepID=A0A6G6WKI8_9ACTN|nr:DUF3224 domain-containing protein [Nocardioides anomalus]QIG45653.1 DUF3224 domain-containing protein [Nocardioides anomalus]
MTTLIARFAVDGWDERSIEGIDDWVGAARLSKRFTAGIAGTSVALFVASGDEGQRGYLAAEHITGTTDDGRSGSVTVHHGALESDPDVAFGHVVPGTGTDDWSGWSGTARIGHDDEGAFFTFDLT